MLDSDADWQMRRSAFNHDWLQNTYLNGVRAFVNRVRVASSSEADLQRFLSAGFREWGKKQPEAEWLVGAFEREVSPRVLFRHSPLSRCHTETHSWLEELTDSLWRTRYPVAKWVEAVREALQNVNAAYGRLASESALDDGTDREYLARKFEEFDSLCTILSRTFSALPHRPLIT